jgi:azurin
VADGSLQRVRCTGDPVQLPCGFHVHENGVLVSFTRPVERALAEKPENHFAQCWNYRYSAGYGSPEFSSRHPGARGHDALEITKAHVLGDGHRLFLELPELQPVNQLHLRLWIDKAAPCDLFLTVHKLDAPFTDLPGYKPAKKIIAAHPILSDIALAARRVPNPFRTRIPNARAVTINADKNLTFDIRSFSVKPGEAIALDFANPDVVPHNWVLVKPGMLDRVGDLANKIVTDPEAAARNYVPESHDVLTYSDIVEPQGQFTIYFKAPLEKGRYPYLCTFPGHWMVMNGQMIVE